MTPSCFSECSRAPRAPTRQAGVRIADAVGRGRWDFRFLVFGEPERGDRLFDSLVFI